jgi:uncharacterized protein YjbI with pentapeptide repeats
MANEEQLSILRQGVDVWNKWRSENRDVKIDLFEADLSEADLRGVIDLRKANLMGANLHGAHLSFAMLTEADLYQARLSQTNLAEADLAGANLWKADLSEANLSKANLYEADLTRANLGKANLSEANLRNARLWNINLTGANLVKANLMQADLHGANLRKSNLSGANISGATLSETSLVGTVIEGAKISGSLVYGISVWDLEGEFEEQKDLIINRKGEPAITVDNIEVAQFIYLILNNEKIRDVINTITSKSVLILGRFALPERKGILEALRNKLREYNLLPIVFDFDRPTDMDFTETIKTLAGISFFVIADITNPKSSPLELQATVPDYQIPFVPIIQEGESPFAMMVDLQKKYPWVLPTRSYDSIETLMQALKSGIIDPAVEMRNKLRLVKAQEQVTESLRDYLGKTL